MADDGPDGRTVVKFELLADNAGIPANTTFKFDGCDRLGAVNLRGTGYASRDIHIREVRARIGGSQLIVEIQVAGLAGFLLAKTEAARSRYFPKDFYDIAFVLLHNDAGGPLEAARAVLASFTAPDLVALRTGLAELRANFANPNDQGAVAYADQMLVDHPDLDRTMLLADAVAAIDQFCTALGS